MEMGIVRRFERADVPASRNKNASAAAEACLDGW
jgi:hypothetical protein